VQRFRGGLVCKDHRLCASLNSRLESNKEEEKIDLGHADDTLGVAVAEPVIHHGVGGCGRDSRVPHLYDHVHGRKHLSTMERIFIELMTSDRKLKASREGSK